MLSEDERRQIVKNTAHCSQALDGIVPNMRDSLAEASADRWKYYAQKVTNPFAEVNIVVVGTVTSAALVTARIKQSIQGTVFQTIAFSAYQKYSIYNQPWIISRDLKKSDAASLCKWTSDEISQIFQLPMQGSYFIGIDRNAFSLMPEVDLLPEQLTDNDREGLYLGQSVSEAEKAADYARSYGFDKAADYIERHYDGDEFIPGEPIPIMTRNMAIDGLESENGVLFERRTVELVDGLSVEGVFPEFESKHHVELGNVANDMSIHQQFNACKEDFQNHMYDSPEKLQDISFGAMERMESPHRYTPEGYTWQHNPEIGSFDLVSQDDHSVGHTGGNALWGI